MPSSTRPSLLVQTLCVLGALVLLMIPVSLVLPAHSTDPFGLAMFLGAYDAVPLGPACWRAFAICVVTVSVGLFVLAQLWRLFARCPRGDVLSAGTTRVFAAFAWGVVALAVRAAAAEEENRAFV